MNFLALCQATARESGTVPNGGVNPLTTVGQTGRLAKCVSWTSQAWTNIQTSREGWDWMQGEWSGTIVAGTARYSPTALGITTRFASWVEDRGFYRPVTLQKASLTVADERAITQIDWTTWRTTYGRGAQTLNRPTCYAISPARELCFGSVPNASYTARGEYRKAAQTLAADTDVPECPERYHMIIAWYAVMMLHAHDEGVANVSLAKMKYDALHTAIVQQCLPQIRVGGGPIA